MRTFSAFFDTPAILIFTRPDEGKWAGVPSTIYPVITYDKDFSQVLKFEIDFEWLRGVVRGKKVAKAPLENYFLQPLEGTYKEKIRLEFKEVSLMEQRETCLTLRCQCQHVGTLEILTGSPAIALAHHLMVA